MRQAVNKHFIFAGFFSLATLAALENLATATTAAADHAEGAVRSGPPEPPPGGHRLPPQAYEACSDRAEGATCSVRFRDEEHVGVCSPDLDDRLFCLLDDPPPPPKGRRPGREGRPTPEVGPALDL